MAKNIENNEVSIRNVCGVGTDNKITKGYTTKHHDESNFISPRLGVSTIKVHRFTNEPTKAWDTLKVFRNYQSIVPITDGSISKPADFIRVVCFSDTHNKTDKLDIPYGDILIHSGDFTNNGTPSEVEKFNTFLGALPHPYKVIIAGNHDITFETEKYENGYFTSRHPKLFNSLEVKKSLTNCFYLEDSGVEILGIKIYGSPWQPAFHNWAFNLARGEEMLSKWNMIPDNMDIIVTHGPCIGQGDLNMGGERSGCVELLLTLQNRVKPKFHICGHIHEGYGVTTDGNITYVNSSICNFQYKPINKPIILDIKKSHSEAVQ